MLKTVFKLWWWTCYHVTQHYFCILKRKNNIQVIIPTFSRPIYFNWTLRRPHFLNYILNLGRGLINIHSQCWNRDILSLFWVVIQLRERCFTCPLKVESSFIHHKTYIAMFWFYYCVWEFSSFPWRLHNFVMAHWQLCRGMGLCWQLVLLLGKQEYGLQRVSIYIHVLVTFRNKWIN